jgi:hypothetical protein
MLIYRWSNDSFSEKLGKSMFQCKMCFLAKVHHHCEIKKIGGKNTHLLGRVQIYEKSVQCGHTKLRMCMKSWQQLEVVKFNTLVETNKIHSKPPLFNS